MGWHYAGGYLPDSTIPFSSLDPDEISYQPVGGRFLMLYQNGSLVRWLHPNEFILQKETKFDSFGNSYETMIFEWNIPFTQAPGQNYQLQHWTLNEVFDYARINSAKSPFFEIQAGCRVEPISNTSIDSSVEQNTYFRFTVNTFSHNTNRVLHASISRNGVVIDSDSYDLSNFNNGPQQGISRSFFINAANYPVGNDYLLTLQLDCGNGNPSTLQSQFAVESAGGGVIDPFLDPGF